MIAGRMTNIFPGRRCKVYLAHLYAKPIIFKKRSVVGYTSKAPDYIVRHRGEVQNLRRQKENDSFPSNPCILRKAKQEIARELQKRKEARSLTKDLGSESPEGKAEENTINVFQYSPHIIVGHKHDGTNT